jgi:glycerol-3-phosphate dehydrogenase
VSANPSAQPAAATRSPHSPQAAPARPLGIITGTPLGLALVARLTADDRPVQACPATAGAAELEGLARACELLVIDAEPGQLPPLARALGEVTDGNHRLAHTVRGVTADGLTAIELLRQETPVRRLGVIAGPLGAADLLAARPTAAVVASRHPEVVDELAAALSTPRLRIYRGRDPLGVELSQGLVELVTFACGVIAGLGFGEATRALLIVRAVRELGRIVVAAGGEPQTASGLAGLGALLVRAHDSGGAAYRLGQAASHGQANDDETGRAQTEALLRTARALRELSRQKKVTAHVVDGVADLLGGTKTPADLLAGLMAIPVLDD